MKIEYFKLLYSTISFSQHSIIWWEINVALKWMCMGVILGSMHVELSELTALMLFTVLEHPGLMHK